MTEIDEEPLSDEEWRQSVEQRLQVLEQRSRVHTRKSAQKTSSVLTLLLVNVVFAFVNSLLVIASSLTSLSLLPSVGFVLLPGVLFSGWGVVVAFALYFLSSDTHRHMDTVHLELIPAVTKRLPMCYLCGRPASHRRAGNWVCDKHGFSR